ncbi:MAG: 2OG-Fe(II) oxygenase, partial [Rhizobacter sp.]|nr:2OG-Fe(II) oxygenase [Rhizobacter sp.]
MDTPDFIEVFDEALDASACRALIERFEASGQATRGETGSGLDVTLKDSWDIRLAEHPVWADVVGQLNAAVVVGLKRYLRRYGHALLAPLQLKLPDP